MGHNDIDNICQPIEVTEGIRVCAVRTTELTPFIDGQLSRLLGSREMALWKDGFNHQGRRLEWLAGRIAGKYVLSRVLSKNTDELPMYNEMEILPDEHGAPVYQGTAGTEAGSDLGVSITHTAGLAMAAGAFARDGYYPGIDIERKDRRLSDRFIGSVYTDKEEEALALLRDDEKQEWRLRLWCAREAAGKSLKMAVVVGTRRFQIEKIDFQTGKIYVAVSGIDKGEHGKDNQSVVLPTQTLIYQDYVLALTVDH